MSKRAISQVRSQYQFIKKQRVEHDVHVMCRLLGVARSGYYKWLKQPVSNRAEEDARLVSLIRASFLASQGIYGARCRILLQ
jgi:putative transposase